MSTTATHLALIAFWTSAAAVAFTYVAYPVLLAVATRLFGRQIAAPVVADADLPSVTLLIAVNNEAAIIGPRLENAVAIDYPRDRFSIVVASDGCSDDTDAIVRTFVSRGVTLDSLPERRGKAATLNRVIPTLTSDVLVLSDGNTFTEPDSVRKLARWFVDPSVGVVCGKLVLVDRATGHNVDGLYWRIETALKEREARLGAINGVNGAIYALRRSVFSPLPPATILDDLVLPLRARLATGCRLRFDAEAVAFEETAIGVDAEFTRRARIGTGGFQALAVLWPLLDPRQGWIAFTFFSHKVLRWTCPLFLLALLIANIPLAGRPGYGAFLVAQIAAHVVALAATRPGVWRRLPRLARLAVMFHSMNAALLVGFWRWLRGAHSGVWQRTDRGGVTAPGETPLGGTIGNSTER
jgi:cellulose synthase/poly-beta-1,6-N-acetylglucosamine synthase-like glycosyltransferase